MGNDANLWAAVGMPRTGSATVKSLTTGTAQHATMAAGQWYEICSPYDLMVQISTDDTSATTGAGMRLPADVVYSFYLDKGYPYISFVNKDADEGGSLCIAITPKSPGGV